MKWAILVLALIFFLVVVTESQVRGQDVAAPRFRSRPYPSILELAALNDGGRMIPRRLEIQTSNQARQQRLRHQGLDNIKRDRARQEQTLRHETHLQQQQHGHDNSRGALNDSRSIQARQRNPSTRRTQQEPQQRFEQHPTQNQQQRSQKHQTLLLPKNQHQQSRQLHPEDSSLLDRQRHYFEERRYFSESNTRNNYRNTRRESGYPESTQNIRTQQERSFAYKSDNRQNIPTQQEINHGFGSEQNIQTHQDRSVDHGSNIQQNIRTNQTRSLDDRSENHRNSHIHQERYLDNKYRNQQNIGIHEDRQLDYGSGNPHNIGIQERYRSHTFNSPRTQRERYLDDRSNNQQSISIQQERYVDSQAENPQNIGIQERHLGHNSKNSRIKQEPYLNPSSESQQNFDHIQRRIISRGNSQKSGTTNPRVGFPNDYNGQRREYFHSQSGYQSNEYYNRNVDSHRTRPDNPRSTRFSEESGYLISPNSKSSLDESPYSIRARPNSISRGEMSHPVDTYTHVPPTENKFFETVPLPKSNFANEHPSSLAETELSVNTQHPHAPSKLASTTRINNATLPNESRKTDSIEAGIMTSSKITGLLPVKGAPTAGTQFLVHSDQPAPSVKVVGVSANEAVGAGVKAASPGLTTPAAKTVTAAAAVSPPLLVQHGNNMTQAGIMQMFSQFIQNSKSLGALMNKINTMGAVNQGMGAVNHGIGVVNHGMGAVNHGLEVVNHPMVPGNHAMEGMAGMYGMASMMNPMPAGGMGFPGMPFFWDMESPDSPDPTPEPSPASAVALPAQQTGTVQAAVVAGESSSVAVAGVGGIPFNVAVVVPTKKLGDSSASNTAAGTVLSGVAPAANNAGSLASSMANAPAIANTGSASSPTVNAPASINTGLASSSFVAAPASKTAPVASYSVNAPATANTGSASSHTVSAPATFNSPTTISSSVPNIPGVSSKQFKELVATLTEHAMRVLKQIYHAPAVSLLAITKQPQPAEMSASMSWSSTQEISTAATTPSTIETSTAVTGEVEIEAEEQITTTTEPPPPPPEEPPPPPPPEEPLPPPPPSPEETPPPPPPETTTEMTLPTTQATVVKLAPPEPPMPAVIETSWGVFTIGENVQDFFFRAMCLLFDDMMLQELESNNSKSRKIGNDLINIKRSQPDLQKRIPCCSNYQSKVAASRD